MSQDVPGINDKGPATTRACSACRASSNDGPAICFCPPECRPVLSRSSVMDANVVALGTEAQGPGSDATAACNSFAAQPPHPSQSHKPRLPPYGSEARRAYIASNKGMTRHGSYSGPAPFGGLRLSVSCSGAGPWSPPQHDAASPGASSVDFLDTPVDMSGLVRERTPKVGPRV